ncbi:MAG: 4-(cytidine 5'-diphospho)-2-C-methyl-D-erythritol kinase [Planctomycetaceae bacterium]|nr:4-(cytidine 5'-diphospho)-2-C-methyl-D-erythritol kinase [Planctomycetaceae bacterium]
MSIVSEPELVLHAPAKLNLFLKILGKRADGYHEIDTVMQSLNLYDTLHLRPRTDDQICLRVVQTLRLRGSMPDRIPTGEENLVVKAARLLQQVCGFRQGAEITLHKRIPSQAGLGGGSADAGMTMRGLNQLWKLGLNSTELARLGAQLGSDIPFFAAGCGLARCQGRGEALSPSLGRPLHFVVVKPATGLSTAAVYANSTASPFFQSGKDVLTALQRPALFELESLLRNGLQESARQLNPRVDRLLELMQKQPFVCSMLSGSGSACFGICRSRGQALHLARRLRGITTEDVFVARSRL